MADSNLGCKLANRYELLEPIGQGSMGRVYLAEDLLLGSVKVAIKLLSQTLPGEKMRERFMQEAMTCAQLGQKSIHVVRVTDYGVSDEGVPFYVMEYLQGQSLSHLINLQPLPIPRFLGLIRQICLGLQSAHEGIILKTQPEPVPIIHRDIKPSNIMIVQDPTLGELAKILDFGIAKLMQVDSDQTNCFMGTLAYASPEQMEGRDLDSRSDIYSLGVMMFQMLTGHLPLRASSHTFGGWYKVHQTQSPKRMGEVASGIKVPKLLEDLVMSCMVKPVEDRPQSTQEILQILEPLQARYVNGFRISQRIGTTLNRVPVTRQPTATEALKDDQVCKLTVWPSTKPVAEIVFPHPLPTSQGPLATLWAMMPEAEINRRLVSTRYNTFICTMAPHPMMLWLTVLYSSTHGARWLPCYLDLKTALGQDMAGLLGKTGSYKLLLFALENPRPCAHVLSCNVSDPQRSLLQEWALTARSRPSTGAIATSRDLLRNELQTKLKAKVLQKLESIYVDTGSSLSD
ncbi:serine/threonine-protein kinase [Leptolyngbya sp. CCNP1308]|uniref:serine/threonine protein kinase n=1 Tax=Leptolyngbya sp. CCNP1308 TaxID=3110255 RepID=UPI002B217AAA|nr:serine/threonine-protein kinase [Leptolyngbya sp. CCNP1308]MEA5452351.1 serine/threonine-protein kinase [Leptolyngbya sp. CCNP1308]